MGPGANSPTLHLRPPCPSSVTAAVRHSGRSLGRISLVLPRDLCVCRLGPPLSLLGAPLLDTFPEARFLSGGTRSDSSSRFTYVHVCRASASPLGSELHAGRDPCPMTIPALGELPARTRCWTNICWVNTLMIQTRTASQLTGPHVAIGSKPTSLLLCFSSSDLGLSDQPRDPRGRHHPYS